MKFISYREWLIEEEARLLVSSEEFRCEACDGEGETECHCECGRCSHEVECDACDGLGTYCFANLSPHSRLRDKYLSLERYEAVLMQEAKQLASYVVRDVFEVLVESGFQPWMSKWKDDKSVRLIPPDARR